LLLFFIAPTLDSLILSICASVFSVLCTYRTLAAR
jgi:hypothetical protein